MEESRINSATFFINLVCNFKRELQIEEIFIGSSLCDKVLLSSEKYYKIDQTRKFVIRATLDEMANKDFFKEIFLISNNISTEWQISYNVIAGRLIEYSMISDNKFRLSQILWANIVVEF
jgi:hypothetical protein